ncbi:MAG: Asp23/Gls24 family envelope stress response protein [Clostridia bacterium]
MSREKSNTEVYSDIIIAIATKSASQVEGIRLLSSDRKKSSRFSSDVQAYLLDGKVKLDIFVNLNYGYNIPNTVCAVQERIKKDIERETCYKVSEINVMVVSIICDDTVTPPIEHLFDDATNEIEKDDLTTDKNN